MREVPAPEDREDILHDAFLSLVRSKSEFRGDSRLQTFVYRVVQIAILQKMRSDKARRRSKMVRLFVELSGESVERELAVTDYGFEKVESDQMAERMYALLPEPLRTGASSARSRRPQLFRGRSPHGFACEHRRHPNFQGSRDPVQAVRRQPRSGTAGREKKILLKAAKKTGEPGN